MNRFLVAAVVSLGGLALCTGRPARAQYPFERPPLSPYLNLVRPGNPAFNYYGLVRPAQEYNKTINQLQQQITANQQELQKVATERGGGGSGNLPQTGHIIGFMAGYQHYFLNMAPSASRNFSTVGFSGAVSSPTVSPTSSSPGYTTPYPAILPSAHRPIIVPRR